jgi:hypothetical protein
MSLAKVNASSKLPNDVEICSPTDLGFQWGDIDERFGGEIARSKVAVGPHLFAEGEDTLLGSDFSSAPFWTSNRSEKDGICGFGSFESFSCQGFTGGVD